MLQNPIISCCFSALAAGMTLARLRQLSTGVSHVGFVYGLSVQVDPSRADDIDGNPDPQAGPDRGAEIPRIRQDDARGADACPDARRTRCNGGSVQGDESRRSAED